MQDSLWPVVDVHVHPKTEDKKLIEDLDAAGIGCAVILATETDPSDIDREEARAWLEDTYLHSPLRYEVAFEYVYESIKKSLRSKTHVDNLKAAELAGKYPQRLIPFGSVNPCRETNSLERGVQEILELDCRGIKLLPYSQFFDPSDCDGIELLAEFCSKNELPILCHSGCAAGIFENPEFSRNSRPMLWDGVLDRHPQLKLILAHFGAYSANYPGIWLGEAVELMRRHATVYADLAAVTALLQNEMLIEHIRREIGLDRLLFGSDYPMPNYVPGGSLKDVVEMIKGMGHLSEKEKAGILGGNACRLLRLQ